MVWIWDLVFVFIIACIVFGAIYAMAVRPTYATRAAAPDDSAADIGCLWLVFLFFLFFMPIWGGGLWLEPVGPAMGGSHVFNFLIIAFVIMLFFAVIWAVIPGTEFSWDDQAAAEASEDDGGWGGLFWIFILILIVIIIFGYIWSSPGTMQNKPAMDSTHGTATTFSVESARQMAEDQKRGEEVVEGWRTYAEGDSKHTKPKDWK